MAHQHLPIWFLGQVPEDICDKARQELMERPLHDATMGVEGDVTSDAQRKTDVVFTDNTYWFCEFLHMAAVRANSECKWDYHLTGSEGLQFAAYSKDHHYDWHVDTFILAGREIDRKITSVCLLNDPSEFEGGEFQIRVYGEYVAPLKKGSLIAFPSILEHRVTPVISGTRYSATMWFNGPRFR